MNRAPIPSAGYTLVELLVVIAIIGLVVAIAAPASVRAVDGARLNADVRALVTDVRGLQARAQTQQKRSVLSVDSGGGILVSGSALTLPNGSTASMVGPSKEITFYENGTVSEGRIRLAIDDRRVDVEIAWLTGKTAIEAVP